MKNNNKGVTLIELIVAFAIVSVATIYFFQTVSLVKKMYANAREETNDYTNKTYAIRMLDSCIDINNTLSPSDLLTECNISGVGKISGMNLVNDKIYNVSIENSNGDSSSFFKYYNQLP